MPKGDSKSQEEQGEKLTQYEAREEEADPAKDDRLGDEGEHALLHAVHHDFHVGRISHGIKWGRSALGKVLQVVTSQKLFAQKLFPRGKARRRQKSAVPLQNFPFQQSLTIGNTHTHTHTQTQTTRPQGVQMTGADGPGRRKRRRKNERVIEREFQDEHTFPCRPSCQPLEAIPWPW